MFQLKETFAIAYGNYTFREALLVTLEKNGEKGFGECTSIDYYQINLTDFQTILEKIKAKHTNKYKKSAVQYYLVEEKAK